jgi:hypothetical protein
MKPVWRFEFMRLFIAISSLSMLVSLTACQSDKSTDIYPPVDGLAAARSAPVPTPITTPFDASQPLRTEYLEAYRDGYRSGLTGMYLTFRKPTKGASPARTTGWQDGGDAGLKEYFFQKNRR